MTDRLLRGLAILLPCLVAYTLIMQAAEITALWRIMRQHVEGHQ